MTAYIARIEKEEVIKNLIIPPQSIPAMVRCLQLSSQIFRGVIDDQIACVWGFIPPSMLSDKAYIWLYTDEKVKDHQFIFIRHSQRVIEDMLEIYPTIVGDAFVENRKAIRWLKWLGAEFSEPVGKKLPFVIRKK
jgi:hypothetical protein